MSWKVKTGRKYQKCVELFSIPTLIYKTSQKIFYFAFLGELVKHLLILYTMFWQLKPRISLTVYGIDIMCDFCTIDKISGTYSSNHILFFRQCLSLATGITFGFQSPKDWELQRAIKEVWRTTCQTGAPNSFLHCKTRYSHKWVQNNEEWQTTVKTSNILVYWIGFNSKLQSAVYHKPFWRRVCILFTVP